VAERSSSGFFTAPADGARLHYLLWEAAPLQPLLLLLHGGGAHAHWWDHVAPAVASGHRVVALDFRGHGDSEHTPGRYGLDRLAGDVESLIDHLGGTAAVVGASMGGQVAMRVAARSERIRRLVIVDVPPGPPPEAFAHRDRLRAAKRYASREEGLTRFRLIPPETAAPSALLAHVAAHSLRETGDGAWTLKFDPAVFAGVGPETPAGFLGRIACPCLIVRGERSRLLLAEVAAAMAGAIPRGRLVTIPGAHHHVFLDKPGEFADAVGRFLAEVGECPGRSV